MKKTLVLLLIGVVALTSLLFPNSSISIDELKNNFKAKYKGEKVTLVGWVTAEKRVDTVSIKSYYLRDRFGSLIQIRTDKKLPEINTKVQVEGVALEDPEFGDIYIQELNTLSFEMGDGKDERSPIVSKENEWIPYLIILIIVVLVALVVLIIWMNKVQKEPIKEGVKVKEEREAINGEIEEDLEVENVKEYNTVKVYETVKALPGKLAILREGKETDSFHLTDSTGKDEIPIGRESPDIKEGIRIIDKSNTMSRWQAKILYRNKKFYLLNIAGEEVNPTIVNGKKLEKDEEVELNLSDVMEMGNVKLKLIPK